MIKEISETKTKHQLLNISEEELNNKLTSLPLLIEFINNLYSILIDEEHTSIYTFEKKDFILETVVNNYDLLDDNLKVKADFILSEISDLFYEDSSIKNLEIEAEKIALIGPKKIMKNAKYKEVVTNCYKDLVSLEKMKTSDIDSQIDKFNKDNNFLITINYLLEFYPEFFSDKEYTNLVLKVLDSKRDKINMSSKEYHTYKNYNNETKDNINYLIKSKKAFKHC